MHKYFFTEEVIKEENSLDYDKASWFGTNLEGYFKNIKHPLEEDFKTKEVLNQVAVVDHEKANNIRSMRLFLCPFCFLYKEHTIWTPRIVCQ